MRGHMVAQSLKLLLYDIRSKKYQEDKENISRKPPKPVK